MKTYYAVITHGPTGRQVTIGEPYEEKLLQSLNDCIRQNKWQVDDCTWNVYTFNL